MQFINSPRGETEVRGITFEQLFKLYKSKVEIIAATKGNFDPEGAAQNFCCEVEKAMGIYPNTGEPSDSLYDVAYEQGSYK